MSETLLNIVVAHALEAKPLIEMLGLKKQRGTSSFPMYQAESGICLVVSGMGKMSAAAATAYLGAKQENQQNKISAWLNIGIAGHQTAELGAGLLANKISEHSTGLAYYPPLLLSGFNSSAVITVDKPELEYPQDVAYDMEAVGFYATATRIVTSELVQVYKIISDNPGNHVQKIDAASIRKWISEQRPQIVNLADQLKVMAQDFNAIYQLSGEYLELNARSNFTATQQVQLKRLCQRYMALGLASQLRCIVDNAGTVTKSILLELEAGLTRAIERES